mmetsp:Transcript_61991/g.92025  ORF Transcript_61991/g.92025 Transcript_61991/m.92025 type:complete len:91 (-) Transcript_61991:296-568(-)
MNKCNFLQKERKIASVKKKKVQQQTTPQHSKLQNCASSKILLRVSTYIYIFTGRKQWNQDPRGVVYLYGCQKGGGGLDLVKAKYVERVCM